MFECLRHHLVLKKLLFLWEFTEKMFWKSVAITANLTVYYKSIALQEAGLVGSVLGVYFERQISLSFIMSPW